MTTILADAKLGVVVADSSLSDGDRLWTGRKVWRVRGALLAFAGKVLERDQFLAWYRGGQQDTPPKFADSSALLLSHEGLFIFNNTCTPEHIVTGREAIGTGAKAAMCAYEALGWIDPKRAVRIVCRHVSTAAQFAPVRRPPRSDVCC